MGKSAAVGDFGLLGPQQDQVWNCPGRAQTQVPGDPPQEARGRHTENAGTWEAGGELQHHREEPGGHGPHFSTWDLMWNLSIVTEQGFDPWILLAQGLFWFLASFPSYLGNMSSNF